MQNMKKENQSQNQETHNANTLQETGTQNHLCFLVCLSPYTRMISYDADQPRKVGKKCGYIGKDCAAKCPKNRKKEWMNDHLLAESRRKGEPLVFTLWDANVSFR